MPICKQSNASTLQIRAMIFKLAQRLIYLSYGLPFANGHGFKNRPGLLLSFVTFACAAPFC